MLPTLRNNRSIRVSWRKLLSNHAETRARSRSFSPTNSSLRRPFLQTQFHFSSAAFDPPKHTLPTNISVFSDELESYAKDGSNKIANAKLNELVNYNRVGDPDTCQWLLQKALALEERYPECRGLIVDGECVFHVLQSLVLNDRVENAHELLTEWFQSMKHIQPRPKWFAVVMKGYANRQNPKALKIMEDMISALEDEQLVQAKSSASPVLDCNTYNILLNAYIQVLGEQAVPYIRTTLDRMQTISKRIDDASLLPDLACYATLMKALLLQCQPGFDLDQVKEVLTQLLADIQSSEKQAHDRMKADVKAMDAWSKSGDSQAAKKARQIFDAMDKPNSSAYNVLCNIYIAIGKLDEVFRLYERMQTHYSSGENKECRPDMHTNSTILKALQKSNRPDATEKAEQIFNSISSPNTVVYNTLLNIYAHTGNVDKALVLFSEMESKYRSGANKNCRPDMHTHATMLNALQKSNREDSIEKAEQIVSRISSPDTVIYTTLLNFYAKHGNVEKALALVREMQSDFDTGKNKNCRPNMRTYATVLNALQKSNVSNAADQAEQIFNSISSPNTIVYNTLLNIYARRGMGQTAVALTRRMQVDFDSGTNRDCRPDDMTETTLWKALDTAKDRRTLEEDGRDVLEWFRKRPNRS